MIKAIGLTKIFRTESVQTIALNEISIDILEGEFVAVFRSVEQPKITRNIQA